MLGVEGLMVAMRHRRMPLQLQEQYEFLPGNISISASGFLTPTLQRHLCCHIHLWATLMDIELGIEAEFPPDDKTKDSSQRILSARIPKRLLLKGLKLPLKWIPVMMT